MKRESDCPLCGARMTPAELLDACGELLSPELGVLAAHCPHCQGYIEVRPSPGQLEIGYLSNGASPRFEAVIALPSPNLECHRGAVPVHLSISLAGRYWAFTE